MNAFKQLQVSIQQLNLRAILQRGINVEMEWLEIVFSFLVLSKYTDKAQTHK